jgi:hypothetical protein
MPPKLAFCGLPALYEVPNVKILLAKAAELRSLNSGTTSPPCIVENDTPAEKLTGEDLRSLFAARSRFLLRGAFAPRRMAIRLDLCSRRESLHRRLPAPTARPMGFQTWRLKGSPC